MSASGRLFVFARHSRTSFRPVAGLSPRKESGTGKILTGATFHGRIASVTGARYDRRISRGRSYIRQTYAERKFPGPRRCYLIAAAVCKAPIETMPRHYARLKNLRGFFRLRVGLPVNGRRRPAERLLDLSRVVRSNSRISHLAEEKSGEIGEIAILRRSIFPLRLSPNSVEKCKFLQVKSDRVLAERFTSKSFEWKKISELDNIWEIL